MTRKLLGIPTQLCTKPLTQPLRSNPSFQLVEDSRSNIARQLRDQDLSAALVSPLEYAKESSDYCIVPNVAAVSSKDSGSIVVRFRETVAGIKTLAVDPNFAWEVILTKIILSEQFEIEPIILPMIASADVMLQKADAALLTGDLAFQSETGSEHYVDIVEEWYEMTGLPVVHAIWCGRESDLTKADITLLQNVDVAAGIKDILQSVPQDERVAAEAYLKSFTHSLDDTARESLAEVMKYLYYHGVLPDVAELNFYKPEEEENDLLSDISPN